MELDRVDIDSKIFRQERITVFIAGASPSNSERHLMAI